MLKQEQVEMLLAILLTDPDLNPVGVELEAKDKASEADMEAEKEEEAEEKYYWEI